MQNFSFDESTKEFLGSPYKVGIFDRNIITNVEVVSPETGSAYIDLFIENLTHGYTMRERIFALNDEVPSWTTPEKELSKLKAKIKHIMARFVPEEEQVFAASSFLDMCKQVKERLDKYAVQPKTEFSLKTVYDKNFQFVVLPSYPPFFASPNDEPLTYSEKERKRNFQEEFPVDIQDAADISNAPEF